MDVEIWPTSIVVPVGYSIGLRVRGSDYEYEGEIGGAAEVASFKNVFTGCGPFLHDDPDDRPVERFGGTTTIHLGPDHLGHVLLPIVPSRS